MSIDVLEQLESKIQILLDSVGMQQLELEELREQKQVIEQENESLKQEQQQWQERLRHLLGKIEEVED